MVSKGNTTLDLHQEKNNTIEMMQIPMVSKGNTTLAAPWKKLDKRNDADPDGFQRKQHLRSAPGTKNTNEMMQIPMVSKGSTTSDLRPEKQYKWNDADPDGFQRKHYLRSAPGKTIQMKWCRPWCFPKETLP